MESEILALDLAACTAAVDADLDGDAFLARDLAACLFRGQSAIGWSLTRTISSPGFKPAWSAGPPSIGSITMKGSSLEISASAGLVAGFVAGPLVAGELVELGFVAGAVVAPGFVAGPFVAGALVEPGSSPVY